MDGVLRTAFRPRWLPRHVLATLLIAALAFLGRWQWDVSSSERGSLQNVLYAFQWWAMAIMVGYAWWRLLRDDTYGRPAPKAKATSARTIADDATWAVGDPQPTTLSDAQALLTEAAAERESDPELDDYNRYLSWLNTRSERAR